MRSTLSCIFTKILKPSAEARPSFLVMLWVRSLILVLVETSNICDEVKRDEWMYNVQVLQKISNRYYLYCFVCRSVTSSVSLGKWILWQIWMLFCWMASTSTWCGGSFLGSILHKDRHCWLTQFILPHYFDSLNYWYSAEQMGKQNKTPHAATVHIKHKLS